MKSRYKRIGVEGKTLLEHRYVMEQIIGRPLTSDEHVHHINGDKFDNRPENLQILSAKDHQNIHNRKYPLTKTCVICGKEYEPYESKRKTGKVCSKECAKAWAKITASKRKRPIQQLSLSGEVIKNWDSARDVQNEMGFFESNISKCCNNKINSYKGYRWRYADDNQGSNE